MIGHLLKLVWNRKRSNGLLILEIFLSFLVVFVVLSFLVSHARRYSKPLGFSYEGVWSVTLRSANGYDWMLEQRETLDRVLAELGSMEQVEAAAAATALPYDGNQSITSTEIDGRRVRAEYVLVTEGFDDVFRIPLSDGRWFEEQDRVADPRAAVIDAHIAREFFPDENPVGKLLPAFGEFRVIGVLPTFRKGGEFSHDMPFLFGRADPHQRERVLTDFAVRVRASATADLEQRLVERIEAIAPEWSVEVKRLERERRTYLRLQSSPLVLMGVIAAFLLMMVGLGLIGVLWQNVTQRTREVGLRRAAGAHRGDIYRQMLLELLLITSVGLALGLATALQFPLLKLMGFPDFRIFAVAAGLAALLIYALALGCGLYPSLLATRIQPAEALHHE